MTVVLSSSVLSCIATRCDEGQDSASELFRNVCIHSYDLAYSLAVVTNAIRNHSSILIE